MYVKITIYYLLNDIYCGAYNGIVISWIVKEMDRKLVVACNIFSTLMALKPGCKL